MKHYFFLSLFLFLLFPFITEGVEVAYPKLPGGWEASLNPSLPEFVRYIYFFAIIASGFIAFGTTVLGGIRYMTSEAVTSKTEARSQIGAGILGTIILLSSYMLLTTVNPQLAIFKFEKAASPLPRCDCANPTEECRKFCPVSFINTKLGEQALELPAGNLVEKILDEDTLQKFDDISKEADRLARIAKTKADEYYALIEQCSCNKAVPHCAVAPKGQCANPLPCTGDACDKDALEQKNAEFQAATEELTRYVETAIGLDISITSGMPPISPGTPVLGGGSCSLGTGACDPSYLSAFGQAAGEASQICQKESGGRVFALNDGCLVGQYDYSVGLFQINLFNTGRCPGAFEVIGRDARGNANTCKIIDQEILNGCMLRYGYGDAYANIQQALGISSNGTNWCPWTTAFPGHCNLCKR